MKAPREQDLVRTCLQYLALRGIPAWRANCGAMKVGRRYVRFGTPGQPDILGLLGPNGRLLCVELKSPRGRLRPEQRAWLEAAGKAGALCVVARSLQELREALAAAGYPEGT